ncbi:hypothetical protein Salat_2066800 [Sesamum alatum]|uniref:Uncharacterized protein n=1 Tax=Sesamum alatum TaxID=300844 RepID=A0AAE1XZY4_9LAMI|nr:hypothetical protein Salat_2066800 [Sesamum alatum]
METQIEGSRTLYKGDTTTYRTTESQETEAVGDEEEDSTPLFNRFQSLQNLEEEDPTMHAQPNLTHATHSIEGKEARDIEQYNTNIINSATEQGSYDQCQTATPIDIQDQLLLDSASSHKHKRNKSREDLHIQDSTKTASKGKRTRAPVLNHNEHRAESVPKNHYGVFPPQLTVRLPTHNRAAPVLNKHYRIFPPQPTVKPPTHHRVAPVPSPSSTN